MAFLYSHLLTPFVLSSMYNWTQMTSGRLTHWQRAVKQRSNNDSASFLSGQAAPCIGISVFLIPVAASFLPPSKYLSFNPT